MTGVIVTGLVLVALVGAFTLGEQYDRTRSRRAHAKAADLLLEQLRDARAARDSITTAWAECERLLVEQGLHLAVAIDERTSLRLAVKKQREILDRVLREDVILNDH